jgi:PAS domain S-box-containing protein
VEVLASTRLESQIQANIPVQFRSPWKTRRTSFLFVAAAFFIEAALIAVLIADRLWRRRAERSLRQREECMSLAADAANLGMWVWDVRKKEIWMTDKGRELLGFAPGQRVDFAALASRVHPDDRAARDAAIGGALENKGEYATEYRVLLPDGNVRWIGARGHSLNNGATKGSGLLGVSIDITAQKQAVEALRESDARFRAMADSAPVMIWMSGTDKLCTFFNKGWLDFTGRPLEQEIGNGWAEGVHGEDLVRCLKVYCSSFDARRPFTMEYRLRRSDGVYRWVLDSGGPRFAPDGMFLGYIGSCIDITERKQALDRFRLVVEGSPNGIVLINRQGHILLVNARAEQLFGYTRDELIDQPIELLVPDRFCGRHPDWAGDNALPPAWVMGAGLELFARRKDGAELPVEMGLSSIQGDEGTLLLAVFVDISARKNAEAEARQYREELTHLSRIEILGEMAASLAHELNQPLTGIMNNASAGRRFISKGRADMPKLTGLLEFIIADARRAGEVIRGIRSLVRKGEVARGPVNLNSIVADVVQFVRSEALERHCVVITKPDPKLPIVIANPVLLQQVLINILVNAFDAMADTPFGDRRVIIRTTCETAGKVKVCVRDFGIGLPMDNPQRIFQNFFSTKREGLGVGLSIVQSIIASHGGELGASNAEGGGACIYFSLPAISEGPVVTREAAAA